MICTCGSKVRCLDTRPSTTNPDEVYRLFKCLECGALIYTVEKKANITDDDFREKWEASARWKAWRHRKKIFQDAYDAVND